MIELRETPSRVQGESCRQVMVKVTVLSGGFYVDVDMALTRGSAGVDARFT